MYRTKYCLLRYDTSQMFVNEVNNLLEKGWDLHGPTFQTHEGTWVQAMTRSIWITAEELDDELCERLTKSG